MSNVGDIVYDKDAVYIDVPGVYKKKRGAADQDGEQQPGDGAEDGEDADEDEIEHSEGDKMVLDLQDARETLTHQLDKSEMRLFSGSEPVLASRVREGAN